MRWRPLYPILVCACIRVVSTLENSKRYDMNIKSILFYSKTIGLPMEFRVQATQDAGQRQSETCSKQGIRESFYTEFLCRTPTLPKKKSTLGQFSCF